MFQLTWSCASLGTGPSGWREVGDTRNIPQPRSSKFSWRSMIDTQVLGQSNWYILLLQTSSDYFDFSTRCFVFFRLPLTHNLNNSCNTSNTKLPCSNVCFQRLSACKQAQGNEDQKDHHFAAKDGHQPEMFPVKKKLLGKVNTVKWKEDKWSSNIFK
jgi:hypothetical protein